MKQAFGIGLRKEHFPDFFPSPIEVKKYPAINFLEIITENYFRSKGSPLEKLLKLREHYPISCHGVSLSVATLDELDFAYIADLKQFYEMIDPILVSDHLCFTGLGHSNTHNLLPFIYNKENLQLISNRIEKIQNFLKREMIFENLSMYLNFNESTFSEAQFMAELHKHTGVKFLLDINNIVVNKKNFHLDPLSYISELPSNAVSELHLAGHSIIKTDQGSFAFDTHSTAIEKETWDLYRLAKNKYPKAFTLIERDENIPPLNELIDELLIAQSICQNSSEQN